ncbi:unnamed protein product [Fraxinus pennsylvanica]|uniref:Uncharacterized protein n=1 Tax=Fraxinus pennsylvanica TaxID=56036 RepID=A0AAD1Z4A1_9LAMI|nr:unnamed protein product [Fraxinus pennsylvanica]
MVQSVPNSPTHRHRIWLHSLLSASLYQFPSSPSSLSYLSTTPSPMPASSLSSPFIWASSEILRPSGIGARRTACGVNACTEDNFSWSKRNRAEDKRDSIWRGWKGIEWVFGEEEAAVLDAVEEGEEVGCGGD